MTISGNNEVELTTINAQMPVTLAKQTRIVAGYENTSRSEIVRRALKQYFQGWEDENPKLAKEIEMMQR